MTQRLTSAATQITNPSAPDADAFPGTLEAFVVGKANDEDQPIIIAKIFQGAAMFGGLMREFFVGMKQECELALRAHCASQQAPVLSRRVTYGVV